MNEKTKIYQTLNALQGYIGRFSVINEKASQWTVGMQIQHCLISTAGICRALAGSKPHTGKIKKSPLRRIVFFTQIIPRGRGKSPEAAMPTETITVSELNQLLEKAEESVAAAASAGPDCYWKHFAFGILKRDEALKFVAFHNKHHLKIIADIVRQNSRRSF